MKKAGFPVKCGLQRRHRTEKPVTEIVPLLVCLNELLTPTTARQLQIEQLLPNKSAHQTAATSEKRGPGRPKGRKNYEKPAPQLTPDLMCLQVQGHRGLVGTAFLPPAA